MALAALGGMTGLTAGGLTLLLGCGWIAALLLWTGGGLAGLLAALAMPRPASKPGASAAQAA